MVGNDVVDIEFASKQSNWRRSGYLNKVFTEQERYFILNSNNPDLTVWLLWSMKESAYKVYVKQFRKNIFAPLRFESYPQKVSASDYNGNVFEEKNSYKTSSQIINNIVYTIAFPEEHQNEKNVIYEKIKFENISYNTQHKNIYLSILDKISHLTKKSQDKLTIKKDAAGIPEVVYSEQNIDISLSLSHHGMYGAYIIMIS